jgi:hypothetical protein
MVRLEAFVQKGDATDMQFSRFQHRMQNVACWALFERNTCNTPLNGFGPTISHQRHQQCRGVIVTPNSFFGRDRSSRELPGRLAFVGKSAVAIGTTVSTASLTARDLSPFATVLANPCQPVSPAQTKLSTLPLRAQQVAQVSKVRQHDLVIALAIALAVVAAPIWSATMRESQQTLEDLINPHRFSDFARQRSTCRQ